VAETKVLTKRVIAIREKSAPEVRQLDLSKLLNSDAGHLRIDRDAEVKEELFRTLLIVEIDERGDDEFENYLMPSAANRVRFGLGQLHLLEGDYVGAARLLERGCAAILGFSIDPDPACTAALSKLYDAQGRYAEGELLRRRRPNKYYTSYAMGILHSAFKGHDRFRDPRPTGL
jgi:hypothetical protein